MEMSETKWYTTIKKETFQNYNEFLALLKVM